MTFFEKVKQEALTMPLGQKVLNFEQEEIPDNWRIQKNKLTNYFRSPLRQWCKFTFDHTTGRLVLFKWGLTGEEDKSPEPAPEPTPAPEPDVVVEPYGQETEIIDEPSSFSFLDKFKLKPDNEQE